MTSKMKLCIAALAAIALIATLGSLWSSHRIAKLHNEVVNARAAAKQTEATAREMEQRAAEYKHKIEYFEESLSALSLIANKQDEELKTLETDSNGARLNVRHARAVHSLEGTTAELCTKLADLGYSCQKRER